jgi:type II secretory pathway component PulC
LRDGIRRTGERQYEVERSTLEAWLGNLPRLAGEARIIPELRDGRSAGFRLMGVRRDGALDAIGLRSGDVIVAINGFEMNGPDQAIAAYVNLRRVGHISIALERGGRKVDQDYAIH